VTYSEKLRDPRWQKKRLEILNRDDFTCIQCGDKESTLHVHHFIYIYGRDPWDYPDVNFIVLCKTCHENETNITQDILTGIIDAAIDPADFYMLNYIFRVLHECSDSKAIIRDLFLKVRDAKRGSDA